MDTKITETIISGMTKSELVAVICAVVTAFSLLVLVLGYILRLHLRPLQDVPKELAKLNAKIKSGEDLNRMIDVKVQEHALDCPARQHCHIQ